MSTEAADSYRCIRRKYNANALSVMGIQLKQSKKIFDLYIIKKAAVKTTAKVTESIDQATLLTSFASLDFLREALFL